MSSSLKSLNIGNTNQIDFSLTIACHLVFNHESTTNQELRNPTMGILKITRTTVVNRYENVKE